jgi:hypothetical protein
MTMRERHTLSLSNYDGVVSALTGNGELCTTLSPTGYHIPPQRAEDTAHRTQRFVWAGRRRQGAQHPLIDFGALWRTLQVDGDDPQVEGWEQEILYESGAVHSVWRHAFIAEETRSFIAWEDNVFLADTALANTDTLPHEIAFTVYYHFGETDARLQISGEGSLVSIAYQIEDHLGDIQFGVQTEGDSGDCRVKIDRNTMGATAAVMATLAPGQRLLLTVWLHFSDRMKYEFPVTQTEIEAVCERHERAWADFWDRSEVVTGDPGVDDFRISSLYTLRCQMTLWSIAPTLSHPYWGGGAFHDEMYPFLGLLSSNHPELAERMPYFRLTTLPRAQKRACARGALYPWSSTEDGEERDPNGLWLTERFHLGQFAVCIHTLWLYEKNLIQLEDLYPVLRETARYFEMNMLEFDTEGKIGTRPCVDFDESVGAVKNGPFTLSAAIFTLRAAADAADLLNRDTERSRRWRELADALIPSFITTTDGVMFGIPDGKPLHYSILGPIFPFRLEVGTERARRSAEYIHEICRSTQGWKPGFSDAFFGSNWMWMAGHLGIVHALHGDSKRAWDAVSHGPASAGPFLSPNEHRDSIGKVVVPWFTTGCGGWLYALNALFVQVDEQGAILLPAVPEQTPNARFRDLRADWGALVSGEFRDGKLIALTARLDEKTHSIQSARIPWSCRIPSRYLSGVPQNCQVVRQMGDFSHLACTLGREPLSLI